MVQAGRAGRQMIYFLTGPLGRWAVIGLAVVSAYFGFAKHYEHRGAARLSAQNERKVEANAKTAQNVRRAVASVPVNGLRDIHTRD